MRFPLYLLLSSVFLLNAAVFADLALYLAVGMFASVELSCSLTTLVLQARLAPIPQLPILAVWSCSRSLSLSLSLKLVCCRLEICNIGPSDCAASVDCAAVCSRSGIGMFWTLLRVIVWAICTSHGTRGVTTAFCATLISSRNSSTSHRLEVSQCPHSDRDISLVELGMRISWSSHCNHTLLVQLSVSVCIQRLYHKLAFRYRASKFALSRSAVLADLPTQTHLSGFLLRLFLCIVCVWGYCFCIATITSTTLSVY